MRSTGGDAGRAAADSEADAGIERPDHRYALEQAQAEAARTTAALRESENRLAEAQRLAHLGSWSIDAATGTRVWSDELYRLWGFEPQEFEPDLARLLERLHPDDAETVRHAALAQRTQREPWEGEFRVLLPDGTVRWLATRTAPLMDHSGTIVGAHGTSQDITERKVAEEQVRFQAHLLEAVGQAIIATDLSGRIRYWGPGAEKLYGWSTQEVSGRTMAEVIPPKADGEDRAEALRRLARGEPWAGTLERGRRDGSRFVAQLTTTPLHDDTGRLVGNISICSDVSLREQARAELERARDHALEASLMKSRFLANMSHEIRTPMNGVLGMTELLLATSLDARQREYAETVQASGDALLAILNDILDVSKVEAGQLVFDSVDFDVTAVIEDVAELFAGQAHAKGLEFGVSIGDDVPAAVRGDPGRLRQVLANLLGNAIKFTATGSVKVSATAKSTDRGGTTLRLQVDDTGIGIEEAQAARIFEPFEQADATTSRQFGGTGLGLTITRQLVELMGGECGVDSRVGVGSSFWCTVVMGARFRPASVSEAGRTSVLMVDDNPTDQGRVLLAEDNLVNQQVALAMLESGGYRVDVVADGVEAVSAVRAQRYDAILMDCHMPRMDGLAAALAIRSEEGGRRRAPIIALTAGAMPEDRERCLAAGMDDHLPKPFKQVDLLATVARWANC